MNEKIKHLKKRSDIFQRKFGRAQAAQLIGFNQQPGEFSRFLRSNNFLCSSDFPNSYLIDKKYMTCESQHISRKSSYQNSRLGKVLKIVHTPLFTSSGIDYIKKCLADSDFFESEKVALKANF